MPLLTNPKMLAQRLLTTTAASVVYTKPTDVTRTHIRTIVLCNLDNATRTISLYLNQGGTQTGDLYALLKGYSLSANDSNQRVYNDNFGLILTGSGASIIATPGTASAITITIFGEEVVET